MIDQKNSSKSILPAPFTIAVLLTFLTIILALFVTEPKQKGSYFLQILSFWEQGIWNSKLLEFAIQMMLMLVLGHTLALSRPINNLIFKVIKYCSNTATAAAIITFSTILVSFFNWGLGLVFGAIFARKVGEYASKNNITLNYPLIGAAGYSGMMVWHGGISGSAPIKIAEEGHFLEEKMGVISQAETIFSNMNIIISIMLLILVPLIMYAVGKRKSGKIINLETDKKEKKELEEITGVEKLDHSKILASIFGGIIICYILYKTFILPEKPSLNIITPNYINLILFGLSILMHQTFANFLKSIQQSIGGTSGILIQFPLYFGIMGIMNQSGLVNIMSSFFVTISNEHTFPVLTFFSAGIVNIFVPSGGGQWAIQGPIIVEAIQASNFNTSIEKSVMALAYGDQITNMLQPFWALPLLAITGLKAKEILPYTLILFFIGTIIFISGLLLF
ncbi:MAG: short-chain fatty acid transporter [Flavobacteriales bacterium]|nr:short-chain fatty acid transporter [Flavobacteriales bacterium]|tara:strand:+ start:27185 stop:28531 length:1347 start_codon:yes stop_codon:yes gene_type:complete